MDHAYDEVMARARTQLAAMDRTVTELGRLTRQHSGKPDDNRRRRGLLDDLLDDLKR